MKKVICLAIVIAILAILPLSVSAVKIGAVTVLDGSGTRVGAGRLFNNSPTDGTILTGVTESDSTSNSLVVWVWYSYMTLDGTTFLPVKVNSQAEQNSAAVTTGVRATTTVVHTPIEARGAFAINSNTAGACRKYNWGTPGSESGMCNEGANCPYNYPYPGN